MKERLYVDARPTGVSKGNKETNQVTVLKEQADTFCFFPFLWFLRTTRQKREVKTGLHRDCGAYSSSFSSRFPLLSSLAKTKKLGRQAAFAQCASDAILAVFQEPFQLVESFIDRSKLVSNRKVKVVQELDDLGGVKKG